MQYTLMKKIIDPDQMEILYEEPFTFDSFAHDFVVRAGEWHVENGFLYGKNRENFAAMATLKEAFFENVVLDFKAKTLLPCCHDINVMWNGSWNERENTRALAYVAGLGGWWEGKVGFEKSPQYALNAGTALFGFEGGKLYHIQCGSIDGHVFIIADGKLLLEVTDPDPIDAKTFGMIGFEAYCSQLCFTDFKVRKATYTPIIPSYQPNF